MEAAKTRRKQGEPGLKRRTEENMKENKEMSDPQCMRQGRGRDGGRGEKDIFTPHHTHTTHTEMLRGPGPGPTALL